MGKIISRKLETKGDWIFSKQSHHFSKKNLLINNYGAQDMVSPLKIVLMMKPQKYMSKVNHKKWGYDPSLNQKILEKNYKDFLKIIKNFGTKIVYLNSNKNNNELYDSIFTHDPSLVIDRGAILLNMGKKLRKKEIYEHKKLFDSNKIPIIGQIKNKGTVEGGDCLWINKKTLLVGQSSRTNDEGIKQLKILLKKFDIKLIPIKLPINKNTNSCFHLMSIVSMLDEDLLIGSYKYMSEKLLSILKKNKINVIKIPESDYKKSKTLAINILALSPRNLVLLDGFHKTSEILDKHKCKLNFFSGNELCIKAEGGPTCLTRAILRE